MRPAGCFALALASLASIQLAADPLPRVTVATSKGDFIDGALRSASETEVVVEVAGLPITLPVAGVKYISFVGRIETAASSTGAGAAKGSIEDAFAALDEVMAALRVGVLRTQYSELLVKHLPRVTAFVESPPADGEWSDLRLALLRARVELEEPMESLAAWKSASYNMTMAGVWVTYAKWLKDQPGERNHKETPFRGTLELGQDVEGRVGVGDTLLADALAEETGLKANPADVYEISLPSLGKVSLLALAPHGAVPPSLVLVDALGKVVDHETDGTLKKDIKMTGKHTVWVVGRPVGAYTLLAAFEVKH